jgi:hypothetical protein
MGMITYETHADHDPFTTSNEEAMRYVPAAWVEDLDDEDRSYWTPIVLNWNDEDDLWED